MASGATSVAALQRDEFAGGDVFLANGHGVLIASDGAKEPIRGVDGDDFPGLESFARDEVLNHGRVSFGGNCITGQPRVEMGR